MAENNGDDDRVDEGGGDGTNDAADDADSQRGEVDDAGRGHFGASGDDEISDDGGPPDDADDDDAADGRPSSARHAGAAADGERKEQLPPLGGPNGSDGVPAYALLVGAIDPKLSSTTPGDRATATIAVPITRLPTTLGREHITKDPSFVGLRDVNDDDAVVAVADDGGGTRRNKAPQMSQSMCCVFYADEHGGRLGRYGKRSRKRDCDGGGDEDDDVDGGGGPTTDGMVYKPLRERDDDDDDAVASDEKAMRREVLRPPGVDGSAPLPRNGFFAVECLGRKITVGGRTLRKGQVAMLADGMPVRIASHCLYFLLPRRPQQRGDGGPPPTIKVKVTVMEMQQQQQQSPSNAGGGGGSPRKKEDGPPVEAASSSSPAKKKARKATGGGGDATTTTPATTTPSSSSSSSSSSIEGKTNIELMALLARKVTEPTWDHSCMKLGSAIAVRACESASRAPSVRRIAAERGGVTVREVADWMASGDPASEFGDYERLVKTRIIDKSFAGGMGKAIVRAGYVKNESSKGKSFRYLLPPGDGARLQPPPPSNNADAGDNGSDGEDAKKTDHGEGEPREIAPNVEGDGGSENI